MLARRSKLAWIAESTEQCLRPPLAEDPGHFAHCWTLHLSLHKHVAAEHIFANMHKNTLQRVSILAVQVLLSQRYDEPCYHIRTCTQEVGNPRCQQVSQDT